MRRRDVIGATIAICGLGALSRGSPLAMPTEAAEHLSLTPVFELLPQLFAVNRVQPHRSSTAVTVQRPKRGAPSPVDWSDSLSYPLIIGLGPRAEQIAEHAVSSLVIPEDAGVYRADNTGVQSAEWLPLRFEKSAAVVVIVDPDDEQARCDSIVLANRLKEADIYLAVALVLDTQVATIDPAWRAALTLPVIGVCKTQPALGTAPIVHALLPGLPFQQQTLVGLDLADIRTVLEVGSCAWTTAIRWQEPSECAPIINRALSMVPRTLPLGVLALLNTGSQFSIDDFHLMVMTLQEHLPAGIAMAAAPVMNERVTNGEVVLSLTVVGSNDAL